MSFSLKRSLFAALCSTFPCMPLAGGIAALVHAERAIAAPAASPEDSKARAATAFEAGATAFKAKNYEEAARQFEAADDAAPAAKALRLAIRARTEAGDVAQAASLAALGTKLYSGDDELQKLAKDTIAKLGPKLESIDVLCATACTLTTGTHGVHGSPATSWTIYVSPGSTSVSALFGDQDSPAQTVNATAGGSASLKFDIPKAHVVAPPAPPDTGTGSGSDTGNSGSKPSDSSGSGSSPSGSETPPSGDDKSGSTDGTAPKKHWGIHPAVFGVSLVVTAALGGTTIWSGVDTQNNPGPDAVKRECAGIGTSCQAYQDGLSHQRRTNILIGVTSGTAVLTVIFAAVTNWHGSPKTDTVSPPSTDPEKPASASRKALAITDPRLWLDVVSANPSSAPFPPGGPGPSPGLDGLVTPPGGAVIGVSGRF